VPGRWQRKEAAPAAAAVLQLQLYLIFSETGGWTVSGHPAAASSF